MSERSSHYGLTRHTQVSQAGAPITVWVKRMDVPGARYAEIENVDVLQTVSKLTACWAAQAKLDVDPSLVTLRLVQCGARKPTPLEEAKADVLDDPRLTLAEAGLTDGCSVLAFVAGTVNQRVSTSVDSPGARMSRVPLHLQLLTDVHAGVRAAFRLADFAQLTASAEHKDVFYLGAGGSPPRSFFLDAELATTSQVQDWLERVRSKWHGIKNVNDPTAISMTITGTPKVRLVRCLRLRFASGLSSLNLTDRKDVFVDQGAACANCQRRTIWCWWRGGGTRVPTVDRQVRPKEWVDRLSVLAARRAAATGGCAGYCRGATRSS